MPPSLFAAHSREPATPRPYRRQLARYHYGLKPQVITFGEMCACCFRDVLIYCRDITIGPTTLVCDPASFSP